MTHTLSNPLHRLVCSLAIGLLTLFSAGATAEMPRLRLTANQVAIDAEVAYTNPDRMQGLMHRRMLPENRGMLFIFNQISLHGMWMMNTYIPLSVAFIDDQGVITNIEDMKPHTRDSHNASRPVRYALEMNLGWFRRHGITPGMRIKGLALAPQPQ